jgi:FkbM family methyltransferase
MGLRFFYLKSKEWVKKIVAPHYWPDIERVKNAILGYGQKSYSQHGEDLLLRGIFGPKTTGFYVDVGAHHPLYLSNSYYFYRRGWRGVNIEPMPDSMRAFRRKRKRDINLELALSDHPQELTFYQFNNRCMNTLSTKTAEQLQKDPSIRLRATTKLTTTTLANVLENYAPEGSKIDFFSIDAESFDLPILKGNDWIRFRPSVILVEDNQFAKESTQSEICRFLSQKGYQLTYISMANLFFLEKDFASKFRNSESQLKNVN